MNWKYAFIALVLLISGVVIGGGTFWFLSQSGLFSVGPAAEATPTPTQAPGTTPTIEPAVPQEEAEVKSTLEQIREGFAEKYNKPIGDVDVNISEDTGTYATGGVKFAGEMGGAMWLAYNDGGEWIIVHDGHGTIPCSAVDPYNFPTDMVPECWDEATSTLVQR